jgi:hypoxanthine-guanine phosphoribosyltransferase
MKNISSHDNITIIFTKSINSFEFEKKLKEYFYKSKSSAISKITFNFQRVSFCGLLELSQISLWMSDLIYKGKNVYFVPPKDSEFYRFLYNYEFINFLINNKVLGDHTIPKKTFTPYTSPMFPMKFQDSDEFKDFMNDLYKPGRIELILSEIKESELVKNNVIHTIILKEIGDNVFIHSKSNFANIIMTKIKKLSEYNVTEFETPFVRKLFNSPVLNIAISDYGEGLYKKLIDTYLQDVILPPETKNNKPKESDIIKYAFLKHSTSRSDTERKKDLVKYLKSDSLKYPLPTGLYKVLSIVKQYNGLLYVRSGKSIVCYDYLSEPNGERIYTNSLEKRFKKLSSFPGTQFKIYFPINKIEKTFYSLYSKDQIDRINTRETILDYISLNDYIDEFFDENINISRIQDLIDKIEKIKLINKEKKGGIIIDVSNFDYVKNKNIKHLIISTIMSAQTTEIAFIIVNLDKNSISEFHIDYSDERFFDYFLPLLAYDNIFNPRVIGLETSYCNDIVKTFETLKSEKDEILFYERCKHIFCYNNSLTVKFDKIRILKFYSKKLGNSINRKILSDKYHVYSKDQKVLIPNKYYCLGFFELSNLDDSKLLSDELSTWISLNLQIERPDLIITIGLNSKKIIDNIYKEFENSKIRVNAKKFNINTSNIYLSSFRLKEIISSDDTIVIITDVIGSSNTLKASIEKISSNNIKKIITIVNATPTNTLFANEINFPINCIVEKNIEYFPSMPRGWDYNDIKVYDIKSDRLIDSGSVPEGPIYEKLSEKKVRDEKGQFLIQINPFIENLNSTENAYFSGHFESRNNHLIYLFNINSIIDVFNKEISDNICDYINEQIKKKDCYQNNDECVDQISYLLYPTFNPGLDKVAESIAKKISSLLLIPVDVNIFENGLSSKYDFHNKTIILIDDAFVTGSTIEKMIDISSERGAKNIFSFVLLKRGNEYQGRRFEKFKQYGDTSVHSRFLVDAEIPIFNKNTCPLCIKNIEYEKIFKKLGDSEAFKDLKYFIKLIQNPYTIRSVSAVFNEHDYILNQSHKLEGHIEGKRIKDDLLDRPYFSDLNLRWKLQRALSSVSMRKNIVEIFKRVKDYKKTNLIIIKILSEEKSYFIDNEKHYEKLFYTKFINSLLYSCKYLLNDLSNLKYYEIISIIDLLLIFDEPYFFEKFHNYLIECQNNEDRFLSIIICLLKSSLSEESPLEVIRQIENIYDKIEIKENSKILDNLILYFKNIQKQKLYDTNLTLSLYKQCRVVLHNINHALTSIEDYLNSNNEDSYHKHYNIFINEVDNFLKILINLLIHYKVNQLTTFL